MQQANAPAHREKLMQSKLQELEGVEILPHPPYSPDCVPSDYGLFRAMQHFLRGRRFNNIDEVDFFVSKDWYFAEIRKLADRWTNVLANDEWSAISFGKCSQIKFTIKKRHLLWDNLKKCGVLLQINSANQM